MSLLFLLLAAAPVEARFVLEVQGVPLAVLQVRVDGRAYTYEATHFLEEGPAKKTVQRSLDDGTPEVLALLTPPPAGCREVVEERTGRAETLCVTKTSALAAEGTVDGKSFAARYAKGRLADISFAQVRWRAVDGAVAPPRESPFHAGVPAPRDATAFSPPVKGARWLSGSPRGVGEGDVSRARCLVLAREWAKSSPGAQLALGLVIEDARAYPHAWVNTPEGPVDPSVLPDDEALHRRRYVEVPREMAGTFFLSLFDGKVKFK